MSSDFADLAQNRHLLQEFCRFHVPSLTRFRADPSFGLHVGEKLGAELRHLTSTATCIESLLDCAPHLRPNDIQTLAETYAIKAIKRKPKLWTSEGSAAIYCRCRALPLVIKYLANYDTRISDHVETILTQLKGTDRFGLGEADPKRDPEEWYPPNAYHTYWFLRICEELASRFPDEFAKIDSSFEISRHKDGMLLWVKSVAGRQVSLHSANSSSLDSDQLAWSLAILTRFYPEIQYNLADQDFLREGFKSLFSKQTEAGFWQHGRPLFHYTFSGNAYCYVYETFTELVKAVLEREKEGEFLRAVLKPFSKNLVDLWNYAQVTQIQLPFNDSKPPILMDIGWSSGHRIDENRREPEGWATASVFSYAQALRRLLGIWTRDEALSGLNCVSAFLTAEADDKIAERGQTWSLSEGSGVGEQLRTLFVNPVKMTKDTERSEPDDQPIRETQARSAILFGPPGTSKTTLTQAVAGEIGWQYVKLDAGHFVAAGLPAVQRTADELFQRLMEIDHTVVLFDEIDELVRERELEADAFGRFLTTSMLPKLAELWDQRKVIYFVATNHIEYFDRAVTRAQRFDALIFVGCPSYGGKIERLQKLVGVLRRDQKVSIELPLKEIMADIEQLDCAEHDKAFDDKSSESKDAIPAEHGLAKFILLRWDQLHELAFRLNEALGVGAKTVTTEQCKTALNQMSDPNLHLLKTFCDYRRAGNYVIQNYSKDVMWEVTNLPANVSYQEPLEVANEKVWLRFHGKPESLTTGSYSYKVQSDGCVIATPQAVKRRVSVARRKLGRKK